MENIFVVRIEGKCSLRSALYLLLGSDITVMTTFSFSAVVCLGRQSCVTFTADHLIALVLPGEDGKRWLNLNRSHAASSQSKDKMKSGLLLDVIVGECPSILKLLACEDQSLLIGWDAFLVLDLGSKQVS